MAEKILACSILDSDHSRVIERVMYHHILIPLENSSADLTILNHIRHLARLTGARLTILHVATGWVARNYRNLNLSESEEIKEDRQYLEGICQDLQKEGFQCEYELAMGEPSAEIIRIAKNRKVDLIAMSTHGHRFLGDLIYGSTADHVRHLVRVPVLLCPVVGGS